MAEVFYEIGDLIGATVRAIQEAQISAEREYLAFLLEYGLEEVTETVNGKKVTFAQLREVTFGMKRAVPDPASPGAVVEHVSTVQAPLLSLVQMPAVGISEATLDLTLNVEADPPGKNAKAGSRSALLPMGQKSLPVLRGMIGTRQVNRSSKAQGRIEVRLTLKATHEDDLHSRISRLLSEGLRTSIEIPVDKKRG